MKNKNLLILGAGQYGTVAKEIARSMEYFEKIDFLDDSYGTEASEYREKSIERLDRYETFSSEYSYAIVAIGNSQLRRSWTAKLEEAGFTVPILVSPRAYVSPSAQLHRGCVIEPFAAVNANALLGACTFVSMGAVVDHNSIIMDCCHIDCGAVIESGALVEFGREVEAGSIVKRRSPKETAEAFCGAVQRA